MNIFKKIFGNGFILTDIRISNIHGFNMALQHVKVHDINITIAGIISEINPKFIQYISVRPKELIPVGGDMIFISDIYEYFEDLKNFYYYISKEDSINESAFIRSYVKLIDNHIEKMGKLVDSDLYTYIDLAVLVKSNLWKVFHNIDFSNEEIANIWLQLEKDSYQTFRESIFITKYDFTNSSINPCMTLIPLTEIT
jgi:hypothetical protein